MFKKTSAFTLIEVLVAAGITVTVIIGCVYLIASSGRQVSAIGELDEIERLRKSHLSCMDGQNMRSYLGGTIQYLYIDTTGCKIGPINGVTATGSTVFYYQESNMSIPYKKETFYTTFQAFTGSLEGEIQIKERIEGPTLNKEFEYSIFEK